MTEGPIVPDPLVLLIGVGLSPWVELLFPAWILALSIDILAAGECSVRRLLRTRQLRP